MIIKHRIERGRRWPLLQSGHFELLCEPWLQSGSLLVISCLLVSVDCKSDQILPGSISFQLRSVRVGPTIRLWPSQRRGFGQITLVFASMWFWHKMD